MTDSLYHILNISRQDMRARLQELDTTSNNLANINTIGYKSSRINFQELLKQTQQDGVYLPSTELLTDQGTLRTTGRGLDLALTGNGYFQIRMADGQIGYSRDGQFSLDSNLNIVNSSGMRLVWQGTIPAGAEEGEVQKDGRGMTGQGEIWTQSGQIQLARFTNPSALLEKGQNLYVLNENSGSAQLGIPGAAPYGEIQSGALEQSNVDSARDMTEMMLLQRDFQISVRAFQQTDTMISQAIQMRRI
jgi:flagellar basal-body rod protein FlgG